MTITDPVAPDVNVDAEVAAEMKRLRKGGQLEIVAAPNSRCRICTDEATRKLVNNLIVRGLKYKDVWLILDGSVNPVRRQQGLKPINQRIIKTHAENHFDLENPSWAIYRKIADRRFRQLGRDTEDGIVTIVTHLAYLDTVVQRGYEDLVAPDTKVGYVDGMNAAIKLADIEAKSAGAQQHAEMLAEVNRFIEVFKENVPPEKWESIVAQLRADPTLPQRVRELPSPDDDDDEDFDPGQDADFEPDPFDD